MCRSIAARSGKTDLSNDARGNEPKGLGEFPTSSSLPSLPYLRTAHLVQRLRVWLSRFSAPRLRQPIFTHFSQPVKSARWHGHTHATKSFAKRTAGPDGSDPW